MASADGARDALRIEVVYGVGPRSVWCWHGELPRGSTVAQAIEASGLARAHPELDLSRAAVGVWGRKRAPGEPLADGDRVEVYRALKVDPKEARRLRYRQHRETLAMRDASKKRDASSEREALARGPKR
jgi:putative ubiquitin-RnfH superfamily antitoxin RatB of RatAB toxin-antitoxin module